VSTILQSPSLINDFADFLAGAPSRDKIVEWRPTQHVQDRYLELAEKRKEETLSPDEAKELEAFLNSEIVLSLLKARLRSNSRLAS